MVVPRIRGGTMVTLDASRPVVAHGHDVAHVVVDGQVVVKSGRLVNVDERAHRRGRSRLRHST